jgi:DNA-directed RNA polymerase beta' subunit
MITFDFLKDEDVLKFASFKLNETWDLFDPRFGTSGGKCVTCKNGVGVCKGHYAYLDLEIHVFHPLFLDEIKTAINTSCTHCGQSYEDVPRIRGKAWNCTNCKRITFRNYNIKVAQPFELRQKEGDSFILPSKAKEILERGQHPCARYIVRYVIIPPTGVRPEEDVEWPSDLSRLYVMLIDAVKQKVKNPRTISNLYAKIVGTKRKEGILKSLSGKSGIFRSIMLGKRLDCSARSVIVGDPNIPIDTIFLPKKIANEIRIGEDVWNGNLPKLKQLANQGQVWWHEQEVPADPSHIVSGLHFDRTLLDGDFILFNRQPSLSRSSLLSFRVKIRHDDILAIAFNPIVAGSFNADFDGDEMNIFAGFGMQSRAEMHELCSVTKHLNFLAPIQDTITGAYLMPKEKLVSLLPFHIRDQYLHKSINKTVVCKEIPALLTDEERIQFFEELQKVACEWMTNTGFFVNADHIQNQKDTIMTMIESGAKGNMMNITQMMDSLGEQYVGGKKEGFIASSFASGLNPQEFFCHARAAREGVINTGVSTAVSGYLNRRACKILADVTVRYNGTITMGNSVIQF